LLVKNFSLKINHTSITTIQSYLTLAKLDSISLLSQDEEEPESAIALVGEMKILIPLAGLIDKGAEQDRLNKEIEKLLN